MSQALPLVIAGGSSLVAPYLIARVEAAGLNAEVISRRHIDVPEGFIFTQMDLTKARNWIAPEDAIVVSLLPIPVLTQFLPRFIGVKAIIMIGSTRHFSHVKNQDEKDKSVVARLELSEEVLRSWCKKSNVDFTLLRPTMVYDGKHDDNVAQIAHFIQRYRFLPLARPAKGLRQPLHAADLAKAIFNSIGNDAVKNKALNIAGGEILTYRELVERIFSRLGQKPRLLMMPKEWLEKIFGLASKAGVIREDAYNSSLFKSMNEDLIFDVAEGLDLLKYDPRGFEPEIL